MNVSEAGMYLKMNQQNFSWADCKSIVSAFLHLRYSCILPTKNFFGSFSDTSLLPKHSSKTRFVTVEPLVFLITFSLGAAGVVQPLYIEERLAQDRNYTLVKDNGENGTCINMNTSNPDYVIQQEIAADLATWSMVNSVLISLPTVFLAPFYGVLSDRIGRKLTFAIPLVAHISQSILLLLILYLQLPLEILSFSYLVAGLGGSLSFLTSNCYAYISDVSIKKARLIRFAVVQTVYLTAAGVAGITAGYMVDGYGFMPVAWISLALEMTAVLYLIIPRVLLEPLAQNTKKQITVRELWNDLHQLFATNHENRRYRLLIFLTIYFLICIIQLSSSTRVFYGIYGLGPPLCWSSITYGYYVIVSAVCGAVGEYNFIFQGNGWGEW